MIHTVEGIIEVRNWQSQSGPMVDYNLKLAGIELPVELTQKPMTPAPTVGGQLDLDVTPHPRLQGRMKGKKVQAQTGFGGIQQGGTAPGGFGSQGNGGMPADREARIVRQHSQEMALHYFALKGKCPESDELMPMIDWFARDAMNAGQS